MESIIPNLSTFGIGGLMAAAIVYIVWHHTSHTIPNLIDQGRQSQEAFLRSLSEQERTCHEAIDKVNLTWAVKVQDLTSIVGRFTDKLDVVSSELRAIKERRI